MTDREQTQKIVAYKLTRPDGRGWMHVGTTPDEVAIAVKNEIELDEGLSAEERGELHVEAYETTQEEIDNLPEFEGW